MFIDEAYDEWCRCCRRDSATIPNMLKCTKKAILKLWQVQLGKSFKFFEKTESHAPFQQFTNPSITNDIYKVLKNIMKISQGTL